MKINLETLRKDISNKAVDDFLTQYPELQKWLTRKEEQTQQKYVRHLMRYIEILHQNKLISSPTPSGLLELARQRNEESQPHIETLEEFQTACEEILPEDKRSLIYGISIAIKSFYNFKGYPFLKFRGSYDYSPKEKEHVPKLEDVIPSIDCVKHIRTKTVIALESCAPLRMGSLLNLKWRHFKEVLENKELPMVKLIATELKGKGKRRYAGLKQICFLTPLARDYVLRYKHWYETKTKKVISPEDPESLELKFLITDEGEPITYSGFNTSFEIAKKMGYIFRLHVWRTTVNEGLMKARISKEHRDVILAHKQPLVESAYTDSEVSKLREEFREAVKYLDPTFKGDERAKKLQDELAKDGFKISDERAKEIIDKSLMSLVSQIKLELKDYRSEE